jgi:hypothetical protein
VRFSGAVEDGRTKPLRVTVERANGTEVDVYLKVADGHEMTIEGLCNEMLGALLAADIGLSVPQPFLVQVSPEFLEALSPALGARLATAPSVLFGSSDAGPEWRLWNNTDPIGSDLLEAAVRTFAFDAFVGNADRRPAKPNLLRAKSGSAIMLIDHEAAFGFRMKLFPRVAPWEAGNLSPLGHRGADSEHLFFGKLTGKGGLPFGSIGPMWSAMSDERLAAYDATLPAEWRGAQGALTDALAHIKVVRDRIDDCLVEVGRVLARCNGSRTHTQFCVTGTTRSLANWSTSA